MQVGKSNSPLVEVLCSDSQADMSLDGNWVLFSRRREANAMVFEGFRRRNDAKR